MVLLSLNKSCRILMKKILFLLFLFSSLLSAYGQDVYDSSKVVSSETLFLRSNPANKKYLTPGQPYMVLDVNPSIGGFYRYRYFEGDRFKFKSTTKPKKQKVNIYSIADTSFTHVTYSEVVRDLNYYNVNFDDISKVYTSRRIPFITEGAFMLPLAGVVYLLADFVNPGIDGQRWNTSTSSVVIGGGLIATGAVFYKMSFRSFKINKRNRLHLLRTY